MSVATGRYRLLKQDFESLRTAGEKAGDRDCLDAKRLGVELDSRVSMEHGIRQATGEAYRLGLDVEAVDLSGLVMAWMDGYRDGYETEQYDDDTADGRER